MNHAWNFFTSGQLVFGSGSIKQLGEQLSRRHLRHAFVVTDPVLVEAGVLGGVNQSLREAGIQFTTFADGEAEPSLECADQALAAAAACSPDVVIGVGGGSNMDLAKFVATVVQHGGKPSDYFGFDNVPGPVLPIVGVPTTAGTGSEVSHAAVLTDTANEMKVSMLSNYLRPQLAIVDPLLTMTCPQQVTADSGIDALTHAIEAYTAVDHDKMQCPPGEGAGYDGRGPLTDCLAEKAIQLVAEHLVDAVRDGGNRQAREGMALAATLAGMAFSNAGVALVHALEYPLGGALHCSHGGGNGLLLPFVMRFNLPERVPALAKVAALLGADTSGMTEAAAAEKAIALVEQLKIDIGIPLRIRDLGGREEQLAGFAEKAFAIKRLQWVNPRRSTLDDLVQIYRAAF